ncbi:hypothetical protein DL764_007774 [Monosporascus ibericus]|uniref:Beta-lactamase-like ARB-00930-like C-terminal domain-containing protein n=1 Tax=Monosporascus ibericus TaxID=155417 RepID=A0A4Q4T203_9PEZI|nr:hypothetical protein DL764_007774 [Monosporascus ibericus]
MVEQDIINYQIGITTLPAGGWPGNANWAMADKIGAILLPAIEQAAREQTGVMQGLGVQNWISIGTDMFSVMMIFTMPGVNVRNPSIRIYPAGLEARN